MRYSIYISLFVLSVLVACKNDKGQGPENTSRMIAKAGDEELHLDELSENSGAGNARDSALIARRLIENWAADALFYQEAKGKLTDDELDVERQVQEYRKSLVNYMYQTRIVEANLDTTVSQEEIEAYYNEHRDNFILRESIIKVFYFKVPVKAPGLDKMKRLVNASTPKDMEQLKALCVQNAENFFINDSTWLFLDDVKKEIPKLADQPDLNITTGKVLDFTDDQFYYHLKIKDMKVKDALSPVNFESQNIKKFIINNRRTLLINNYKKLLLEKGMAEKKVIVY